MYEIENWNDGQDVNSMHLKSYRELKMRTLEIVYQAMKYIAMYSKFSTRNADFLLSETNSEKKKMKLLAKECLPKSKLNLSYLVFSGEFLKDMLYPIET